MTQATVRQLPAPMVAEQQLEIRRFTGPSLLAPFPAVVAEFPSPTRWSLPVSRLEDHLRDFLPGALLERISPPPADGSFERVAGALASAIQDLPGPSGLGLRVERLADGRRRIILECLDPAAAEVALRTGYEIAAALFARVAGRPVDARSLEAGFARVADIMRGRQPDPLARSLIRLARRRGIPVRPVVPGSRVWLYGEGSAGWQMFEAASHRDGLTAGRLARNKFISNQLVTALGFPGVRHDIARSRDEVRSLAGRLGYPLVVKPLASGKGRGVTADIRTEADLLAAFDRAHQIDPGNVLVEGHLAGDDHRLAVFGGRLAWASRRSPPRVTGDGRHTITELIEEENRRRRAAPAADLAPGPVVIDDEVRGLLARQGLEPGSRPAAGTVVRLRTIANTSRGGQVTDCTAVIHPDNRTMAEAIARAFHFDAAGIDFLTPDIGRSWRDGGCAVIEVNATPGFSSDERAELILASRFPPGTNGRLPSVVLVELDEESLETAGEALAAGGRVVGRTSGESTWSGGEPRFAGPAVLPDRVAALLLDPACAGLVIAVTMAELEQHGFPLGRCDLALTPASVPLPEEMARLVTACAGRVVPVAGPADVAAAVAALPLPAVARAA